MLKKRVMTDSSETTEKGFQTGAVREDMRQVDLIKL